MRWVKLSTLCAEFDVSNSTIHRLMKDGIYQENIHFKVFPFGKRFNITAIEKLKGKDPVIERLLDDMLQC